MTRKRALLITIIVLLAAAVITASIVLSPKNTTNPTPPNSLGTNAEGFEISPVKAGEGGTTLAPDGITPIGYPPTCDGAYAAAINYRKTLQTTDETWPNVRKTLLAISASPNALESRISLTDELIEKYGAKNFVSVDMKALGIFKPLECTKGKVAKVLVSEVSFLQYPETSPSAIVQAVPIDLVWQDGDWKIASSSEASPAESLSLELQTSGPVSITPKITDALFTAKDGQSISRDGWMVISNATQ